MSNDYSKSVGVDGGQGKHRGPRFTWNTQYEATFFRSLCESVQLGLREGSTFKPEAWDRAIQALIEKHNAFANKGHLINKSDNARKKYRLWRGLREDPEFYYNQQTKSVNGSEEAWARHLQKEPLARSLKGRPFEHEEYFEILFPDVIGSGGAPKRMTKPRRKGPDIINGIEEHEGPGTSLMDMLSDASYLNPVQNHLPPPVQSNAIPPPMPAPLPPQPQQLSHPPPAPMAPPPPPRTSTVSTSSALTPPEENPAQSRNKRQHTSNTNRGPSPSQPEKRRRTQAPNYIDLQQSNKTTNSNSHVNGNTVNGNVVNGNSSAGSNTSTGNVNTGGNTTTTHNSNNNSHSAAATSSAIAALATPTVTPSGTISDGITLVLEALRGAKARPKWQEQAMEIFFRDFREEDPDLQLKIAEKLLTDENKAMFFCMMPEPLRNHWVKRLREVHSRAT